MDPASTHPVFRQARLADLEERAEELIAAARKAEHRGEDLEAAELWERAGLMLALAVRLRS